MFSKTKIVNWVLGITGTLLSTLIIGSIALLIKLDNRTKELVTVFKVTSIHLKEGVEKATESISDNSTAISDVKHRVTKLELRKEYESIYSEKLFSLVEKIESKMEEDIPTISKPPKEENK